MGHVIKQNHSVESTERVNELKPFQVTLITSNRLYTQFLPSSRNGEYFISAGKARLLSVFASGGLWVVRALSGYIMDANHNKELTTTLYDGGYWYLINDGKRRVFFAEEVSSQNFSYRRYSLQETKGIEIGRDDKCNIQFDNPFVSRRHAYIEYKEGSFYIEDINSTNGVYVNGARVQATELQLGDTVSILSLRIIVGIGFLGINDSSKTMRVGIQSLRMYQYPSEFSRRHCYETSESGSVVKYYNRLPRRRLPLKVEKISIDLPPYKINNSGIPLMLRMGRSVTSGATSLFTGNPLMLLSSILFPFLSEKYSAKQREDYEIRRVKTYTEYLREKKREIKNAKLREEHVLRSNYPEMEVVLDYPLLRKKLWERRNVDDDFLVLRLGAGNIPLNATITYPDQHMSLENDNLENDMYDLVKEQYYLEDVPILADLIKHRMCGVIGRRELGIEFAHRVIMRIASLYSYDEVKLVILSRPNEMNALEFVRYLPHVWNDQRTMRFVAVCQNDAYLIGEYLSKQLEDDIKSPRPLKQILRSRPYYVVIALDKHLQDCMEIIKTCCQVDDNCGLSVISIFTEIPKDCTLQVTLRERGVHSLSDLGNPEQNDEQFRIDTLNSDKAVSAASILSNTVIKSIDSKYSLPKTLTFLEMYKVGKVSRLNILSRWEENDPYVSLAVPVGVDTSGNAFTLDLHQKYQGPHGLVAGMTGSGKSEFLITYILSMAINFRPDEVSFLLIDYKGGGLAGAFEDARNGIKLPHLVGTITNLDGPAIQRSLISLQSESLRRQRIFNEAKSIVGESTMDIYEYQRLYRLGFVTKSVSHLFIISDEFAELHDQQREFLDQLISIARIGRSLGIHLILATQKPGGLVNEQILSNTKFRVCLKVQSRSDSNDMLKRPEAAELMDAGRFYLQVGYNEMFALAQSAWCGAQYIPQEDITASIDESVSLIGDTGQQLVKVKRKAIDEVSKGSQLQQIVTYLGKIAVKNGFEAQCLWKPPLGKRLDIEELDELYEQDTNSSGLRVCVGMIDDPELQEQYPLIIDIAEWNNMLVVGAAKSGKTTFIQTILLQLLRSYTPEQLNIYILDYSSRLLSIYKQFQHCGAVLVEADEGQLKSFMKLIEEIIEERKRIFERLGVDSIEAANMQLKSKLPIVLIVIDNITGMNASRLGEEYAYRMDMHLKQGVQYGIKYLLTSNHPNEVNIRARREIDQRLALSAKDRYEYEEILNCRVSYTPPTNPGRGLYVINGRPLEVQLACVGANLRVSERIQKLKNDVSKAMNEQSYSKSAKALPIVDESIRYEVFCKLFSHRRLPLGYHIDDAKPVALPLRQMNGLSLFFGNEQSIIPVLSNILIFSKREDMKVVFIRKIIRSNIDNLMKACNSDTHGGKLSIVDSTDSKVKYLVELIIRELQQRQKQWDELKISSNYEKGKVDPFDYMSKTTQSWLIVFESFSDICNMEPDVQKSLISLMPLLHQFNMYAIGCFYPEDSKRIVNNPLNRAMNNNDTVLLFGGKYSEQKCTNLPSEIMRIKEEKEYNRCLVKYRDKIYDVLMPCIKLDNIVLHEDEQSIFGT